MMATISKGSAVAENLGSLGVEPEFLKALWSLDAPRLRALAASHPEEVKALCAGDLMAKDSSDVGEGNWRRDGEIRKSWAVGQRANKEEAGRWADTMRTLFELGFWPRDVLTWRGLALRDKVHVAELECLIDAGFFPKKAISRADPERFVGSRGIEGVICACEMAAEGGREPVEFVEKLARAGIAGDDDCCVNMTDFAVAELWECAAKLKSLGFKPGVCRGGWISQGMADPMMALLSSFSQRGSARERFGPDAAKDPAKELEEALAMSEAIDRWVALGAKLDLSKQGEAWGNPFYVLLGQTSFGNERAQTHAMLDVLGAKLLSMGADPNAGGWLQLACARVDVFAKAWSTGVDGDWVWAWALRMGMDPAKCVDQSLGELSGLRDEDEAVAFAAKFKALGVDSALTPKDGPFAPVHRAFDRDFPKLAWFLIDQGAPMDGVDGEGETVLHKLAGKPGRAKVLAKALEKAPLAAVIESESKAEGRLGERALHQACAGQNIAGMKSLLEHGADPNAKDAKGWTPLRHLLRKFGAAAQKKVEPALRLLLEHGADPSVVDNKGLTPGQAVAGKAPMVAIEKLLGMRPQDVAGEGEAAQKTKSALRSRGGQGASLAEKIDLETASAPAARAEKKPPRSRL